MVKSKVTEILDLLEQKPKVSRCSRIGQRKSGTVRPSKFSVQSSNTVYQILRSAKLLKEIDDFKNIYLYVLIKQLRKEPIIANWLSS